MPRSMSVNRKIGLGVLAVGLLVVLGLWQQVSRQPLYDPPVPDPGPLPEWVFETGPAQENGQTWTMWIKFMEVILDEATTPVDTNAYARVIRAHEEGGWTYKRGGVRAFEAQWVDVREGEVLVFERGEWMPVLSASGTNEVFLGERVFLRGTSVEGGSDVKLDVLGEVSRKGSYSRDANRNYIRLNTDVRRVGGEIVLLKGQMALFGGSVQQYAEHKVSSVPFFGGLPLVGRLFEFGRDLLVPHELMVTVKEGEMRKSP